ncbi:PREDICTED: probable apyrase 7 isoform X2 [Ipomoea nil]|uniref:probable apyrase 7 isoform X2 n=1 Tax=Ipomoea nil TaxID=35883 RepID=UPI0009013661|nr:PREDICTED: probable apyrase 7 isoform X2 [Ipomoea nil]
MVLNKIAGSVSAFVARFSTPKTTTTPYVSSGLPPLPGSIHGYNIPSVGQKSKLRLSTSLQDFSVYRQHDVEYGDLNPEMERILAKSHQDTFFLRENDGSSFSKERGSPKQPSGWKKWLIVLLILFLLLIASVLCISLSYYFKLSEGATRFYVVLDCGSTGTRVYVYQSSINHNTDSSLPVLLRSMPEGFQRKSKSQSGRAYNRMETEPGLDKLVHNVSGLRGAIGPLIQWAENQIPRHAHKTTSLFLYATAGVRRLPSSDSKWLLDNAWSLLRGSPFLCKREWVKIISGEDEAYFGWIALNYDAGVLGTRPKKETFGALDLGGSSLQVTFESKESFKDATGLKLSIGPVNHQLTGYSLPGYGLNDAFDKSVAYLFKKLSKINDADLASGNVEIKHPCLQFGYKEQYVCFNCVPQSPISEHPPSVRGEFSKGGKHGIPIQLVGTPEWNECSSLAKIVVNSSGSLEGSHPHPTGQFYAMSGFYVVYRFFNLASDANLDVVLQKGQEFCKKAWDVAKKSVAPQPFIEQYCFRAPYIAYLLREGLHISDSNVIIDSGRTTWTLGVALLEAGKAVSTKFEFQNYQIFQMKIKAVLPWIALLASLVVLLCALLCIGNWIPKFFRKTYLPVFRHNNASTTYIMQNPFKFQRWSPISTGDGREKVPLSPTIAATQRRAFDTGYGFGGHDVQLSESSPYPSSSGVTHSYSSGSLGQMQFDNNTMGSFRPPHRSQQRLQSRRSQSREDLHSSLAEANGVKV